MFDSLCLMRESSLGDNLVEFQGQVMYISRVYVYTKKQILTTKRNESKPTEQDKIESNIIKVWFLYK